MGILQLLLIIMVKIVKAIIIIIIVSGIIYTKVVHVMHDS